MKEHFKISDTLEGKPEKLRQKILNDKEISKIYVCLYMCPGNCATDPTCPWKKPA